MINYTIARINDRSKENIKKNKNILKNLKYVDDIDFFNGLEFDGEKKLLDLGIDITTWNPYDGRKSKPLPGEYGAMVTKINTLKYMLDKSLSNLLFFEDDIILDEKFYKKFFLCLKELPKDFDFLSLYYFEDQNYITTKSEINLKYIHKSINQYAGTQIMYYSLIGANKILDLLYKKGMQYTADCFIFEQSRLGLLNGYSIKPNFLILGKQDNSLKSMVDSENIRNKK